MSWPSAVQAHLSSRLPFVVRWLVWTVAKPFGGGAPVGIGLWTGDDHETLTVEGAARTYYGAQGGLGVAPISYKVGTEVASMNVGLSLSPEGVLLVRGYDTRLAPADVHCAVYDAQTGGLLGIRRMFRGVVDRTHIGTPAQDGRADMSLTLVSSARRGTMTAAGHKSDASQRLRDPNDAFRVDSDKGVSPSDPWAGE